MRPDDEVGVRPRTFTETARRAQILGCAIEVLAELGYAQTSLARVAERAGTSKSVISYHFVGKDELLHQVVAQVHTQAAEYMWPRIEAQEAAPAKLAAYLRSNLQFIRDHPSAIAAITEIVAGMRTSGGSPRFAGGPRGIDQALKPLQTILVQGQADGDFAEFDTRTMAWAIRNLVDGVARRPALDPEFDFAMCIEELAALVARATTASQP